MGQTFTQQCTRLSSPLPSWPLPLLTLQLQLTPPPQPMLQLPPTTNPPHTRRRSSPLSHLPTSTELLMTTARPTSRRPGSRMAMVLSLVASSLLFPTAESRPPPTPLTTSTDSLLMSHTREPPSTPLSPKRDTATPPPPTSPPLLTLPPLLTSPLPKKSTRSLKKLSSGIQD